MLIFVNYNVSGFSVGMVELLAMNTCLGMGRIPSALPESPHPFFYKIRLCHDYDENSEKAQPLY